MTVVVGAISGKHVWLAADSYCSDGELAERRQEPKIVRIGPIGLGFSGSVRKERVLVSAIERILTKRKRVTAAWLKSGFLDELRAAIKDEKDQALEGSLMIAHASCIYYIDDDLALCTPYLPYAAIGSGRSIALGALAFAHESDMLVNHPEDTLATVLEITSRHSHFVRAPYEYLKI